MKPPSITSFNLLWRCLACGGHFYTDHHDTHKARGRLYYTVTCPCGTVVAACQEDVLPVYVAHAMPKPALEHTMLMAERATPTPGPG